MKNAKLYLLVAGLTAANVGFRFLSPNDQGPMLVSHLEAGDKIESVELAQLLPIDDIDPSQCSMVVAFSADCPFCEQAAQRENLVTRSGTYAEPLWVTGEERPRLSTFAEGLSPDSRHAVAPEAFEALDVDAVPALYLLDGERTVRWVGAYRGDESTEVLAQRCEGPASADPEVVASATTVVGQ